MKQIGKTWHTPEGHETLAKYLPAHTKLFEKLGQKIAAEALSLEQSLRDARLTFVDMCKEALRNNPDKGPQRRFTFYTFDKEFKIEFDIKEEYVRVYKAIKKNPTHKDYEMISLDFNKAEIAEIAGLSRDSVMVNEAMSIPDGCENATEEQAAMQVLDHIGFPIQVEAQTMETAVAEECLPDTPKEISSDGQLFNN